MHEERDWKMKKVRIQPHQTVAKEKRIDMHYGHRDFSK